VEFVNTFKSEEYTEENFAKLAQIKAAYDEKINACAILEEIQSLAYLARSEMWGVESKADTALQTQKVSAKAELQAYKKENDYLALDWKTLQSVLAQSNADIDAATSETQVVEIVGKAKARMDAVAQKGDLDRIPEGTKAETDGGQNNAASGCGSALYSLGTAAILAVGAAACLCKKKRQKGDEDDER
jgi:hypothetical protein